MMGMKPLTLSACLLFLSSSHNHAAAFISKPHVALLKTDLQTKVNLQSDNQDGIGNARNFPPIEPTTGLEKDLTACGISPRMARVISPLQALLAMPIIIGGGATGANALEGDFESAVDEYFPGSLPSGDVLDIAVDTLNSYGSKSETLFGTSICPDEVNTKPGKQSLATALQEGVSKQNGVFNLGGLAGLPFVGISGMGAFLSHCPSQGRVVIFFGPHVGISDGGVVGKVERLGRKSLSGACGAALGAYKAIKAENLEKSKADTLKAEEEALRAAIETLETSDPSSSAVSTRLKIINSLRESLVQLAEESDLLEKENAQLKAQLSSVGGDTIDYQEEYIIEQLRPTLQDVSFVDENKAIAYVTTQVYTMIFEMLKMELKACWKAPDFWTNIDEITLLGGVLINRGQTGLKASEDYFQPLKFETLSKNGKMIGRLDLFESAFGQLV